MFKEPWDERFRLGLLVWEKVKSDQIPLRAGALSFTTLASLLPIIAVTLAVLSSPFFEAQRERVIDRVATAVIPSPLGTNEAESPGEYDVQSQRQVSVEKLKLQFRAVIDELSGNLGKIGLLSFAVLLYIAVQAFQTVEHTFNAIWKVTQGRSIFMKLAICTAFLFWGPVIVGLAMGVGGNLPSVPVLGRFVMPLVLTGVAFTAFYMIMPHVKVRVAAALAGGFAAAAAWELSKLGFLLYVQYVVGSNKLYGSLGLVPVVFAWVFISWMVVLAGAELAYLVQHRSAMMEQWNAVQREKARQHDPWVVGDADFARLPVLAWAAAVEVARLHAAGEAAGGVSLAALAKGLGAETAQLSRALGRLEHGGVLSRLAMKDNDEDQKDPKYLPASDLKHLTMQQVWTAARGPRPSMGGHERLDQARAWMDRLHGEGARALDDLTLAAFLEREGKGGGGEGKSEAQTAEAKEDTGDAPPVDTPEPAPAK